MSTKRHSGTAEMNPSVSNMTEEQIRSVDRKQEALRRLQDPPVVRLPNGVRVTLTGWQDQAIYDTLTASTDFSLWPRPTKPPSVIKTPPAPRLPNRLGRRGRR